MLATRTSPGCSRAKSAGPASTPRRAGDLPGARPDTAAAPHRSAPAPRQEASGRTPSPTSCPAGAPAAASPAAAPATPPAAAPRPHRAGRARTARAAPRGSPNGVAEHVVRAARHTGRDRRRAQLAQHPAQLRPGQADVGKGVFAQRRGRSCASAGPAQEGGTAHRVQPGRHPLGRLVTALRRAPLPLAGLGSPAVEIEPHRSDHRSRGRPPAPGWRDRGCRRCARAGRGAARTGRATTCHVTASTPAGGSSASIAATVCCGDAVRSARRQRRPRPGPGGEVEERLLGADGRALEPDQERGRRRVARPADGASSYRVERRLAGHHLRNDRLDRRCSRPCPRRAARPRRRAARCPSYPPPAGPRRARRPGRTAGSARSRQRSRADPPPRISSLNAGPEARVIRAMPRRL